MVFTSSRCKLVQLWQWIYDTVPLSAVRADACGRLGQVRRNRPDGARATAGTTPPRSTHAARVIDAQGPRVACAGHLHAHCALRASRHSPFDSSLSASMPRQRRDTRAEGVGVSDLTLRGPVAGGVLAIRKRG